MAITLTMPCELTNILLGEEMGSAVKNVVNATAEAAESF